MLAALLLAAACTPDLVNYSPTPVLSWDFVADTPGAIVRGYAPYYRPASGGGWLPLVYVPCDFPDYDGDGIWDAKWCRGGTLGLPLQRYLPNQLEAFEFCIRAYDDELDESVTCTPIQPPDPPTVCMPSLWPGPPAAFQ